MNIKKLIGIIVGGTIFILCAYYLIYYFQWSAAFQLLKNVNWIWMPCIVAFTIIIFWLFRTIRWFVLLKETGIHMNFYRLYLIGSISVALAILTPLQSGEALKIELLKKAGHLERIPGYGIFFTERILDLIIVILIAISSIMFGLSKILNKEIILIAATIILICIIIFLTIIRHVSSDNIIGRFLQPFNQCVRNGKVLATVVLLTIGGWSFVILGWYASLRSISISVNFLDTAAMTAITTLIGILSLIPWSLGINEVSISSFLAYYIQDTTLAQAGALIIRVYGILTLLMGIILFFIWKLIPSRG